MEIYEAIFLFKPNSNPASWWRFTRQYSYSNLTLTHHRDTPCSELVEIYEATRQYSYSNLTLTHHRDTPCSELVEIYEAIFLLKPNSNPSQRHTMQRAGGDLRGNILNSNPRHTSELVEIYEAIFLLKPNSNPSQRHTMQRAGGIYEAIFLLKPNSITETHHAASWWRFTRLYSYSNLTLTYHRDTPCSELVEIYEAIFLFKPNSYPSQRHTMQRAGGDLRGYILTLT